MPDTRRQILADTLEKLRKRIQSIRNTKESIGEQNTRATLIDPLLSALGWNLEDLDEVSREYKRKPQDNPVDYSLFLLRSPRLFVEAKALERDLNDRKWVSQTLSYTTVVGVEWCVLTNGDEYRLYNAHAAVDVDEKLFRNVRVSDPNQKQFTLETLELLSKEKMGENLLNVLWKAHFVDRNVKKALSDLLRNEDSGLVRLLRKRTTRLKPSEIRASLRRASIRIDFPVVAEFFAPPDEAAEIRKRRKLAAQKAARTRRERLQAGEDQQETVRPKKELAQVDTIVVPAREMGFRQVFLGENRWYAVRIHGSMQSRLKYIAVYRVAPTSAITHIAPVKSVEPWKDTGKCVVNFSEPAREIRPIPKSRKGAGFQGIRYTTRERLLSAKTVIDI